LKTGLCGSREGHNLNGEEKILFLVGNRIPNLIHYNDCANSVALQSSSSIGTTTLSWVSACSTVVEHFQQEGFKECRCQRHVKPPTWKTRDLERSNVRHKRPPASKAKLANPAAEGGTMGEKWPRIPYIMHINSTIHAMCV
jgi:hypothetical protein